MSAVKRIALFAGVVAALAGLVPANAHHSVPAYFDVSKTLTLTGTVFQFKFQNPHSILSLYVTNAKGEVEQWRAEASLAAWLIRNGWRPEMFKPGTKLTVTGAPARDPAAKMIRLMTVTFPDGRKLNANNGAVTS